MKQIFAVLAILAIWPLGGCAVFNENRDYEKYVDNEPLHYQHEATRITNQTNGIVTLAQSFKPKTEGEALMMRVISMDRIAQLKPMPYTVARPVGGYDVLMRHTGTIVGGAVTGILGYFNNEVLKAFAEGWGTPSISSETGTININESLNRSEQHTTGSDGATSSLSPYIAKPETVQPEVVIVPGAA